MQIKDYLALLASLIALVLTLVNIYFTHFRGASLQAVAGEKVGFYYFNEGNLAVVVTVAVVNHGIRSDTLQKLALLVRSPGGADAYLLEPLFYEKLKENGDLLHDSEPAPIPVSGRSTVVKHVLFRASYERPEEFLITAVGTYQLALLAWVRDSIKPVVSQGFTVELSAHDIDKLKDYRSEKKTTLVNVRQSQWRKWYPHYLTEVEFAALQGTHRGA